MEAALCSRARSVLLRMSLHFCASVAGGLGVGCQQIIAQNDGRLIDAGADLFEQLDAAQVGVAHFAGMDVDVVDSEDGVGAAGQHQQQQSAKAGE